MELSSTKIVLNKEPAEQKAPAVKERHESEKVFRVLIYLISQTPFFLNIEYRPCLSALL